MQDLHTYLTTQSQSREAGLIIYKNDSSLDNLKSALQSNNYYITNNVAETFASLKSHQKTAWLITEAELRHAYSVAKQWPLQAIELFDNVSGERFYLDSIGGSSTNLALVASEDLYKQAMQSDIDLGSVCGMTYNLDSK